MASNGGLPLTSHSAPPAAIVAAPVTTSPPRRRRIRRYSIYGIGVTTKPTIRRLARRGGVKRVAGLMYEETRGCMIPYIQGLLMDAILHTEHDHRTTITARDVVHALRHSGKNLYGFGI
ncbi:Histone H4 [Mycena venus]|uniref:Histone H4 n=1 Tax=Mycena venus TaxID=2733690 RepID=A0A8H7CHJ6_9AGAR|nr:Histone H4 [Mycena venus]